MKRNYYKYLDKKARRISRKLLQSKPRVTSLILDCVKELYESSKLDQYNKDRFESAYHNAISSDFEFLIARVLYHYINLKKLNWKIYLRCQRKKTAPDIRIESGKKTIAIIEIKAKAGWIQSLFSEDTYKKAMKKYRNDESSSDPRKLRKTFKKQLKKYFATHKINLKQYFLILPALTQVHRKRSGNDLDSYRDYFCNITGLKKNSFILLSGKLDINFTKKPHKKDYQPTIYFENFVKDIVHD